MFNSPVRLAATAAGIGAIANTLRLEMVDMTAIPPAGAAFVGALTAGILASLIKSKVGYPRISLTEFHLLLKSVYLIATRDLSNLWLQFFLSQNQGFMRLFEKTVLK